MKVKEGTENDLIRTVLSHGLCWERVAIVLGVKVVLGAGWCVLSFCCCVLVVWFVRGTIVMSTCHPWCLLCNQKTNIISLTLCCGVL